MADVNLPESIPCHFNENGWSPCKKPTDNGWCSEHENLKCVSCGEKAIKKCDHAMGGLTCGSPLCDTCSHDSESNKHITKEVAVQKRLKKKSEDEELIASRTSLVQRMNDELGVPYNLFELLKTDLQKNGYQLMKLYFLELKHGLMGFFPAVFSFDEKRIIFTKDLCLLEKVWDVLEPREAKITTQIAYVNLDLNIGYIDSINVLDREKMKPFKILAEVEFYYLCKNTEDPFQWASGLISLCEDVSSVNYLKQFPEQALIIDPTFVSSLIF